MFGRLVALRGGVSNSIPASARRRPCLDDAAELGDGWANGCTAQSSRDGPCRRGECDTRIGHDPPRTAPKPTAASRRRPRVTLDQVWAGLTSGPSPGLVSAKTVAESVVGTTRPLGLLSLLSPVFALALSRGNPSASAAKFWISWPHPGQGFGIKPLEHLRTCLDPTL